MTAPCNLAGEGTAMRSGRLTGEQQRLAAPARADTPRGLWGVAGVVVVFVLFAPATNTDRLVAGRGRPIFGGLVGLS